MKSKKQKDIGNILLLMGLGILLFSGSLFLNKMPSTFVFCATMAIGCIVSVAGYVIKTRV